MPLSASREDLRDLANSRPALMDGREETPTGATLTRFIGGGGMASVFLAEIDTARPLHRLRPQTPSRVAVKFMLPETEYELTRENVDPITVFRKEEVALGRVTERVPPTEYVVDFYGSGSSLVELSGGPSHMLPWIAIEYVDGGTAGTTLTERVNRAIEGYDPLRVLRTARGIFEGVQILHTAPVNVIHRDIKPDNVLIAGPIDDETPKLTDCGIARVEGIGGGTIAAMSHEWGGPEQAMAMMTGVSNPLIGPWTDVHALAVVVWFMCGGEAWCRDATADTEWQNGRRRTLKTAERMHQGFVTNLHLLERLDAVLARGAATRLPDIAWQNAAAQQVRPVAHRVCRGLEQGVPRYATVAEFAGDLFPILEEIGRDWALHAARTNHACTAFRSTHLVRTQDLDKSRPPASVREVPRTSRRWERELVTNLTPALPGNIVFQPDGRILARFGDRLVYYVDAEPRGVARSHASIVACSSWVTRGPGGGFAVVGRDQILLVRGGNFSTVPLPQRPGGGEVGDIEAVLGDGRVFAVVTEETDDSNGGAELWRSTDGIVWSTPTVLPLNGTIRAIAEGPFGMLVVGNRGSKRGRALFMGLEGRATVFTEGVSDKPPLTVACCSGGRESWAAGQGTVLRFDQGLVTSEDIEIDEPANAMGLDVVGVPWLVTSRSVLRRHDDKGQGTWKLYYRSNGSELVGIGFTPDGARVVDAMGTLIDIEPSDIGAWRARTR